MPDAPITRETLSDMCDRLVRNSILLRTVRLAEGETIPVGATKFGGMPDVPEWFEWPMDEVQLSFAFQVNCQQVAPYDTDHLLPAKGILYFFCCEEVGEDAAVIYIADDDNLSRFQFPEDAELNEELQVFDEHRVLFEVEKCLPDYMDLAEFPGFPPIDRDIYHEVVLEKGCRLPAKHPSEDRITHRMLGYPALTQNSVAAFMVKADTEKKNNPAVAGEVPGENWWENLSRNLHAQAETGLQDAIERFKRCISLFQLDSTCCKMDENDVDYLFIFYDCGRIHYCPCDGSKTLAFRRHL